MKYTWTYKLGKLDECDREYFERVNGDYKCTGETIEERYEEKEGRDEGATIYVVMKATGNLTAWTPYQMCRDCGDHYIIAKLCRYDRIDKGTLKVTRDVEDI